MQLAGSSSSNSVEAAWPRWGRMSKRRRQRREPISHVEFQLGSLMILNNSLDITQLKPLCLSLSCPSVTFLSCWSCVEVDLVFRNVNCLDLELAATRRNPSLEKVGKSGAQLTSSLFSCQHRVESAQVKTGSGKQTTQEELGWPLF